jgi:hypothetical protein
VQRAFTDDGDRQIYKIAGDFAVCGLGFQAEDVFTQPLNRIRVKLREKRTVFYATKNYNNKAI